jgi:hypothetical protein
LHAISAAAQQAHDQGEYERLVIDHVIPSAELVARLKRKSFSDAKELRSFLAKWFTLALLTKDEHDQLLKPFKSSLPSTWDDAQFEADGSRRYCRYEHPSIRIEFTVLNGH